MMSEFERRISVAATRKNAGLQTTTLAQQTQIVKVAIADWHSRIAPMVEQAVSKANGQLAGVGIHLNISRDVAHNFDLGRAGEAMPMRPVIKISSTWSPTPQGNPALDSALRKAVLDRAARPPAIQIGLGTDASIFVAAQYCSMPRKTPIPSSQIDKAQIRAIIADYVDAIIPGVK
jgi:hypothetical protein